jgi:hypothetical protein
VQRWATIEFRFRSYQGPEAEVQRAHVRFTTPSPNFNREFFSRIHCSQEKCPEVIERRKPARRSVAHGSPLYLQKGTTMLEFTGTKRQLDPTYSTTPQKIEEQKRESLSASKASPFSSSSIRQTFSAEQLNERIARRAYEIYEARGRQGGQELEDWLRAEQQVKSETIG